TLDRLVETTLGQKSAAFFRRDMRHAETSHRPSVLTVRHLGVGERVRDVSLSAHRGEIVGMCGLLGAGQHELGRALFGDRTGVTGTIEREGRRVMMSSPRR